jgi:hypothetical protein
MELMKDTYIPVFSNKPTDYREWRQRINLYRRKLELQNKGKEAVLNVLTSLHGVAWRQLEPKVDNILAKDEGAFDLILAELDATFRYNEDVEMPRAFEKFFYGTSRKPDQTLLSYVADHREALGEVEKHGVQISDKDTGWILLRRSGLTHEQKQLILSQNPKLTYAKVVEAMYFLLGQDYKGKPVDTASRWKGKTYGRWNNRGYGYNAERWTSPTWRTMPTSNGMRLKPMKIGLKSVRSPTTMRTPSTPWTTRTPSSRTRSMVMKLHWKKLTRHILTPGATSLS